ncbi:MAG: hypothetical protein GC201_15720 [Alphaproteobacteria bacterium]|nr:hypothetical protein [Alphaproteobacteria bacterium]
MTLPNLPDLTAEQIREACRRAGMEAEHTALLEPDMSASGYAARLWSAGQEEAAIRFSAQALPKEDAIRWGYELVRGGLKPDTPVSPLDMGALHAVYAWVVAPGEQARCAALDCVDDVDPQTPSVWLAYAVAWSGGSMVRGDDTPVPPPEHLTGIAVAMAVLLSGSG